MRRRIPLKSMAAISAVVILVISACGGGDDPTATPRPTATPGVAPAPTATPVPPTLVPLPTATARPTPTPNPTPTPTPEAQRPLRGGILRDRLNADLRRGQSWDAAQAGGIVQIRVIPTLFNGVLMGDELDPTVIKGDLAETWSVSDDGLAYTFKIRDGIIFNDGEPLKASDIIWSYNRIMGVVDTGYRSHINNLFAPYIESMDAPDDTTLVIRVKFPSLAFIQATANLFAVVYPERIGNEYLASPNNPPIGTGAFTLLDRQPDIRIRVRRNPNYFKTDEFGDQLPYLDGIDFEIIRDSNTAFAALRTGKFLQSDYLDPGILNTNIDQFKKDFPDWVIETGFGSWREYAFRDKPPWDDVRIRRALDMLVDRPSFVAARYPGYGHSGASPMLPPSLGGVYGLTDQETSTLINTGEVTQAIKDQARELFRQAGIDYDSFVIPLLTLGLQQYDDDALLLKDSWEKAGLTVDFIIPSGGPADFAVKRITGDFDIYYVPASSFGDDPDFVLGLFFPTGAGQNYGKFSDPEVDRLYMEQQREIDLTKRIAIARDLQRLILTEANWHPKIAWAGAWTAVSPRLRNYTAVCPGAYCFRSRMEIVWLAPE
ncbi:MAG: ABC transporter substrate-binding protein [Dehalococcoidia bacterium]